MGLTTQYLRYVPGSMFGVICSGSSICFVTRFCQKGKYVAVPACEKVFIWDMHKRAKVLTLDAEGQGEALVLAARPPAPGTLDNTHLAVGYLSGSITVFDLHVGQPLTFAGHKSPVTAVAWDHQGMRVASGSSDGEIVLWDVLAMAQNTGHKQTQPAGMSES
ncbi:WD repeat-containing protein 3-like [Oratosquilla oratoria]|uniref:WD repeat-containing protein 3-like n=1 Tax=Oratosquilla oratoria TaxID=337810 RepID=UPI003F76EADA